jgi:hypothetical protein
VYEVNEDFSVWTPYAAEPHVGIVVSNDLKTEDQKLELVLGFTLTIRECDSPSEPICMWYLYLRDWVYGKVNREEDEGFEFRNCIHEEAKKVRRAVKRSVSEEEVRTWI